MKFSWLRTPKLNPASPFSYSVLRIAYCVLRVVIPAKAGIHLLSLAVRTTHDDITARGGRNQAAFGHSYRRERRKQK